MKKIYFSILFLLPYFVSAMEKGEKQAKEILLGNINQGIDPEVATILKRWSVHLPRQYSGLSTGISRTKAKRLENKIKQD